MRAGVDAGVEPQAVVVQPVPALAAPSTLVEILLMWSGAALGVATAMDAAE